jgi:hypothetical protein
MLTATLFRDRNQVLTVEFTQQGTTRTFQTSKKLQGHSEQKTLNADYGAP